MAGVEIKDILSILNNDCEKAVRKAESAYVESVREAASFAVLNRKRIILIAGPSGSGKTTTSELLLKELSDMGYNATAISTDDFYRSLDDPDYPRDESGELDFESVKALQSDKIIKCMSDIIERGETCLPKYVFEKGISVPCAIPLRLSRDGILIIEGIHAFNPLFLREELDKYVMRVYVSVSTEILEEGRKLLSGKDLRFIRRMTRDSIYRGTDAKGTLDRWPSVLAGEELYLDPYKDTANVRIDTFHMHELGVIKPYAEKAMEDSSEIGSAYIDNVRKVLSRFDEISVSVISSESLLREFIP